ncbi:MAG: DUF484 family protein [Paracoccaceae bacterium]
MRDDARAASALRLDTEERDLVRSLILADPSLVLDDDAVMRALIGATGPLGRNVVDLRDKLVERLETRLSHLKATNRSVVAAAYENVASTEAVHAAAMALVEADDLGAFARALSQDLPARVGIEAARLCVEEDVEDVEPADVLGEGGFGVMLVPYGALGRYLAASPPGAAVILRAAPAEAEALYAAGVASEALMPFEVEGRPALFALGSADPDRFSPDQGTDLLAFLARVAAVTARRHLAAYDAA